MTPGDTPASPDPFSWSPVLPEQAAAWMAGLGVPWWISGGWGLDLFLGTQTRAHADMDVAILRRDVLQVLSHLASWEIFEALNGVLTRLPAGSTPRTEVNQLFCRPAGAASWSLELMLEMSAGDCWLFRRDPAVRRPLSEVIRSTARSVPFVAPEVQLLYKARALRTKDQMDFDNVVPRLDAAARDWLREALRIAHPAHGWIRRLNFR